MAQGQTARHWEAVRAESDLQFAPLPEPRPPETPEWLKRLQEWLRDLLGPAGEWIGQNWPLLRWILLGIAALLLLILAWRLIAPQLGLRRPRNAEAENWTPDEEAALALLEDADALAAAGRFDEATHLLLLRSVRQIRDARPDWLEPSSTAREIAALPGLPDKERGAFALIAERVERAVFALSPLDAGDWQAARAAYADFALARLPAAGAP
ncbi:MAG: hypothetical protein H6914_09955 [Novosphingobium sp.]|nr:hypothetical protein [Novosphingobium sp.]